MVDIEVVISNQFTKAYNKLDYSLQKEITHRIIIFKNNWQDPRLKVHKLSGSMKDIWAFRVNYSIRIIFKFESDKLILLLDVGSHDKVYSKH